MPEQKLCPFIWGQNPVSLELKIWILNVESPVLKSLSMKGKRNCLDHGIMDERIFLNGRNMSMLTFWLAWSGWKEPVGYAGDKKHKSY